jgi:hypothetical protein
MEEKEQKIVEEDKQKFYKLLREQIEHEDGLVNQRLSWLLFAQGFLFTFFYTLFSTLLSKVELFDILITVLKIVSIVGILLCILTMLSIRGAYNAVEHIRKMWYKRFPEEGEPHKDNDINLKDKQFPDITHKGFNGLGTSSLVSSFGIPFCIISVWLFCFFKLAVDKRTVEKIQNTKVKFSIEGQDAGSQKILQTIPKTNLIKVKIEDERIDSLKK